MIYLVWTSRKSTRASLLEVGGRSVSKSTSVACSSMLPSKKV